MMVLTMRKGSCFLADPSYLAAINAARGGRTTHEAAIRTRIGGAGGAMMGRERGRQAKIPA
jgi:hypothetical protein